MRKANKITRTASIFLICLLIGSVASRTINSLAFDQEIHAFGFIKKSSLPSKSDTQFPYEAKEVEVGSEDDLADKKESKSLSSFVFLPNSLALSQYLSGNFYISSYALGNTPGIPLYLSKKSLRI